MSKLDIVVFGASGFTGKYVVENLMQVSLEEQYSDLTWGMAGRSAEKLRTTLDDVNILGVDTSKIPIVVADVNDEKSLRDMAANARVLVNCTGPYSVMGEKVVRICIEKGTHYVDITAELHFMLKTYRDFNKAAEEANVLVITACGYASVPASMGFQYLQKQHKGDLHSVDCYTELLIPKRLQFPGPGKSLVHYGTWASLVYEFQNFREYARLKNETFPETLYQDEIKKRSFFHKSNGKFWFPYPGPDSDVVEMDQRILHQTKRKKPSHFNIYTTMPTFYHLLIIVPVFFFYFYASFLKCFRKLLWKFPRFFTLGYMSHKGPSKQNMQELGYNFVFSGKGHISTDSEPDKTHSNQDVKIKVSGHDPYNATAIAVVHSAITVLRDQAMMPRGGVFGPGASFSETNLIQRLHDHGIKFEVIE